MTSFKHKPQYFYDHAHLACLSALWLFIMLCLLTAPLSAQAQYRVLMLGDSITAGYGLPAQESLPVQLQQAINQRLGEGMMQIINGGVSGDTTTGGAARLEWLLADDIDAVVVALGGNDTLRGINPEQSYASLRNIITTLQQRSLPVLLAGMQAPRNMGEKFVVAFDSIYPRLANEFDLLFYPFLLEGVAALPEMNQDDGIHPNARGVSHIVTEMLPYLVQLHTQLQESG